MSTNEELERTWRENNGKIIELEGVTLKFCNLAGRESRYNARGDRNFNIVLNKEQYDMLNAMGMNIKVVRDKNTDEVVEYRMKVKASYDGYYPPEIYLISSKKRLLSADELSLIDDAVYDRTIKNVDIRMRASRGKGRTDEYGLSAYVKNMWVELEEDHFAAKYAKYDNYGNDDDDCPFEVQ